MNKNIQTGFYLIEVLVSLFVLSIGVLCAAGMQLTALQTVQQSAYQTLALQLAADMANQIRTISNTAGLNDEQNPYLSLNYRSGDQIVASATPCYSVNESCKPIELANSAIHEWEQKINENLPQGRVVICRDAKPWDINAGQYRWRCNSEPNRKSPIVIKLSWYEKQSNKPVQNDSDKNLLPIIALVVGI